MTGSVTRSGDIQDNTDSKLNFSHHFVGYYKPSIGLPSPTVKFSSAC